MTSLFTWFEAGLLSPTPTPITPKIPSGQPQKVLRCLLTVCVIFLASLESRGIFCLPRLLVDARGGLRDSGVAGRSSGPGGTTVRLETSIAQWQCSVSTCVVFNCIVVAFKSIKSNR